MVAPEKRGQQLNSKIAAQQIVTTLNSSSGVPKVFEIKPRVVVPSATLNNLQPAKREAQRLRANTVAITDSGRKVTTLDNFNYSQLLTNRGSKLAINQKTLNRFVAQELSLYFFKPPVHRRTKTVNGKTAVLNPGKPGVELDYESATAVLSEQLLDGTDSIELPTRALKPATVHNGVYPKTNAGLHALISDFDAEKSGDYRIIVHQLKGGNLRATHKGLTPTLPASTYKAFIAYAAMKAAELGQMTLNDRTPHGTVSECMYEMIHVSTDHCAWAIQDLMGWQRVDNFLHAAGFKDTKINNQTMQTDKTTTALDEFRLFRGLYDGSLLNKAHTNHILDLFKNQMWRSGIPAGSPGAVVADKVGFFVAYRNDVGIVYAPKNDYIIVALSDGGSFWEISQLANRVYKFFGN